MDCGAAEIFHLNLHTKINNMKDAIKKTVDYWASVAFSGEQNWDNGIRFRWRWRGLINGTITSRKAQHHNNELDRI